MANKPGDPNPRFFRRGQPLRAEDLNQIVSAIIKRIYGAEPIQVKGGAAGNIIIAISDESSPRKNKVTAPVTLTGEVGAGVYTFKAFCNGGPPDGHAVEVNGTAGIAIPSNVVVTRGIKLGEAGPGKSYFQVGGGGGGGTSLRYGNIDTSPTPGVYQIDETDYLGGPLKIPSSTFFAEESTLSTVVAPGLPVVCYPAANAHGFAFWFPAQTCL